MDQSERNQHGGPEVDGRRPLDLLREQISAAQQSSAMSLTPKPLRAVLGMLDAYLVATEARITALEVVAHAPLGQEAIYDRLEVLERQVKSIQLRPPDRTESARITNRAGSIDIPLTADGAIDYVRVLGGDDDG